MLASPSESKFKQLLLGLLAWLQCPLKLRSYNIKEFDIMLYIYIIISSIYGF